MDTLATSDLCFPEMATRGPGEWRVPEWWLLREYVVLVVWFRRKAIRQGETYNYQ